jgi:hypothetical protein
MSPDPTFVEKRSATMISNTDAVPAGTLITAPTAPSTGSPGTAPVVAANTTHWYQDPTFIATASGAVLTLIPVAAQALQEKTFDWKSFTASCFLALGAYFRNRNNTVLK